MREDFGGFGEYGNNYRFWGRWLAGNNSLEEFGDCRVLFTAGGAVRAVCWIAGRLTQSLLSVDERYYRTGW